MAATFADDILKHIFLIEIPLKYVPWDLMDNNPALVQIMAWRRKGDIIWTNDGQACWRIYASLGLNKLRREVKEEIGRSYQQC